MFLSFGRNFLQSFGGRGKSTVANVEKGGTLLGHRASMGIEFSNVPLRKGGQQR